MSGEASAARVDAQQRKRVEDLTAEHLPYLRALAGRLCRSQLDPDDLVQDLFEKLMQRTDPIPDNVNERAWLSRVLTNLFIDKLRRRDARREDPLGEPGSAPPDDATWWQRLTPEDIRSSLAQLPDDQRVTFDLFTFEGRSYDQIAAELQIAKATVGSRIHRARERLRALLSARRSDD